MPEIESVQNPRIKHVVKLREDRRQRQRDSLTLVEGRYELELALAGGLQHREIFYCAELSDGKPIAHLPLPATTVTRAVFEKMSHREGPDGWLAVVTPRRLELGSLQLGSSPLLLMAEAVEKPGNLGAIFRTADSAGVEAVLVAEPRVELFSPGVIRASRGTVFTVPAVESGNAALFSWFKQNKIRILAATPQAERKYTEIDYRTPICFAVGTEDAGLSSFWMERADIQVRIPMYGKVNSLNVSASTAILLYEAVRQRGGED
jgi:TrmH family RNA methyltransferase